MISFFKIEKREEKRKFKHIFICHPELDSGSSEEYFTLYFISWPSRHFSCGKTLSPLTVINLTLSLTYRERIEGWISRNISMKKDTETSLA
jgi:hypothetical protein|tara:strand:- start:5069 stop:5341 length:273 start_codon:yes stop_codon:yes gene_type:complete